MKPRPVIFTWSDDGTMVPQPRFLQLCDKQYVIGAEYTLEVVEPRSMKNHSHYFACIHTAWDNLPDQFQKKYPTEEALRAKALVATGFSTERDYVCDSPAKAAYLARIIRAYAEYAVIKVSGNVVKVFEAKSQSVAAMGNDEFKASKESVLDWIQALNPGLDLAVIKKEAAKVAPPEQKPKSAYAWQFWPTHPVTGPAYFAYARSWILAAVDKKIDKDRAWRRWDGERDLRDLLRVSIPNRRELKGLLARQFEEAEAAR
jgi:hypothetical protein